MSCLFSSKKNAKVPFGGVIGVAPGGVVAYSSHYESADPKEYPSNSSYICHHDGVYTGYKYQCVEFARRFLVQVAGITFGDVQMAYHIFDIRSFKHVKSGEEVAIVREANGGGKSRPVPGSVLLWQEGGYFKHTGHVGIVTEVTDTYVRIAEQNVTDRSWGEGNNFARELAVTIDPTTNGFTIHETHWRSNVLGWVTPTQFLKQPLF